MPVAPKDAGGYVDEVPDGGRTILGVATSITAFLGRACRGPTHQPVLIDGFGEFERIFGRLDADCPLGYALRDFFLNGGDQAIIVRIPPSGGGDANGGRLTSADILGREEDKTGIFALLKTDLFNLLCIPADTRAGTTDPIVYRNAAAFCEKHRAMLIIDSPADWSSANPPTALLADPAKALGELGINGLSAPNAAIYFPRLLEADPLSEGQIDTFVPCGAIAGIMARTDAQRGVWKAPAGLDASIAGIHGLEVNLDDEESGTLNRLGINCLRSFPTSGCVAWGARTMGGGDHFADEYKYVAVRRLSLFIEESVSRGLQWVVLEPNDDALRAQIRAAVGAFLHDLFRQGAFQGATSREAYFVKCDRETTAQNDVDLGILNVVIGFAPLKPSEFVILTLQQMAGQAGGQSE
jgi:hypothetical protein